MTAPTEQDLKFFHCEERSNLPTNGGRLSTIEIISGVVNNVWPHVLRVQRENGDELLRKLALKIHQDGDGKLATTEFCIDGPTLGDDRIFMFGGTATDTQADITGSERRFCSGGLVSPITAGDHTVVFAVKHVDDLAGIQIGDDFRLSDKLTPASTTGNVEYHTVEGKSVSGLNITITTTLPIGNSYAAYSAGSGGKVGVIYKAGETKAYNNTITKSSAAGTFDADTFPLLWNNMGADEHQIVHTFTDDTHFTAVSSRFGSLGSGIRSSNFSPLHPTWNKALYTLPAGFWGGTWANGNTLTIPMHAAAAYVWEQRVVPIGCAPMSANKVILCNRSEGL